MRNSNKHMENHKRFHIEECFNDGANWIGFEEAERNQL